MTDKPLVLVTGVTGFIAGHTAEELLRHGFRVRGTARGAKYDQLVETVKVPDLEFARVDDVATGDFTEALKGVDAVVHIACPLPGKTNIDETFRSAIEGMMNVVHQAYAVGIRKFVATSSFGTLLRPNHMPAFQGLTFNETMWGELIEEEFLQNQGDKYYVYFTAKIRAEQALWEFADEHPDISVATILPGYVIGPYPRTFPWPSSIATTGTNDFVHGMINNGEIPWAPNWIADVRDVAKGHVLALERLPLPAGDIGRFIISGGTYPWKKAAEHLKKVRPELADRIVDLETVKPLPGVLSNLDTTRAKEILGIEFIPTEKTFEDTVDDLLVLEKQWAKN